MTADPGVPSTVWDLLVERKKIHMDCIYAGADKCCFDCGIEITHCFSLAYPDLHGMDLLGRIMQDFLKESL